jgi:hypothetical protein
MPVRNFKGLRAKMSPERQAKNRLESERMEMNKLQIVNAPLKVLIAYPNSRSHGDKMLEGYREIVSAADIFNDISTSRPQLVRFGFPGPPWQGFVYTGSGSNGFSPELLNA